MRRAVFRVGLASVVARNAQAMLAGVSALPENFRMSYANGYTPGTFPLQVEVVPGAGVQSGQTVTMRRSPTLSPWSPTVLASFTLTDTHLSSGFGGALNLPTSGSGILQLDIAGQGSWLLAYGTPVAAAITSPTSLTTTEGIYAATFTFNQPGRIIDIIGRDAFGKTCRSAQPATSFTITDADGLPIDVTNVQDFEPGTLGSFEYTLVFETLQGVISEHTVTDVIQAADKTPDSFAATDLTNVAITGSTYLFDPPDGTSDRFVSGLGPGVSVPGTESGDGEISRDGGVTWISGALGNFSNGNPFRRRFLRPTANDQSRVQNLTIGTVTDSWVASSPSSYDADATTYFALMATQPDTTFKQAVSDWVTATKTAGVWAKCDVINFAAHDLASTLLNAKQNLYHGTAVGTVDHVAYRGTSVSANARMINSNFNPTTASSPNYVLNSAGFTVYSRDTSNVASATMQEVNGTSGFMSIRSNNGNTMRGWVNSATATNWGTTTTGGNFTLSRLPANDNRAFQNATQVGTATTAATSLTNESFRWHNAPSGNNFSSRQLLIKIIHGGLTPSEVAALHAANDAFALAVGANV